MDRANNITEEGATQLEQDTRGQSDSKLWFKERLWRITASRFGEIICATENRDKKLLCASLFSHQKLKTPAVIHGQTWEKVAVKALEEKHSIKVSESGLFVSPCYPFLGASPDGLIGTEGIVEVKCPYNGRNSQISPSKLFPFLKQEDEKLELKRNHRYFYQIMGQLAISRRQYCLFVVYTHCDLFVQKIIYESTFFDQEMLPKLKDFYDNDYRPYVASQM